MSAFGAALLILVSMASRDCLGATSTAFIAEGRRFLAGLFDGACDLAGVVSFGGATAVMLEHGYLSWQFGLAALAVVVGSVAGTWLGMAMSAAIDRLMPPTRRRYLVGEHGPEALVPISR